MAASQLEIYNDALLLCEERLLANTSEARKPRYLLDQVWNNGGVQACLEEGLWTFATRTVSIAFNGSINPSFGYIHAFDKPSDYVRTAAISSEPYFSSALTRVADEAGEWWADLDTLYVKYVSNDANYGNNLARWPESFKAFVAAHFADKIVKNLTHNKEVQEKVELARKMTLASSRGKDAMNEPAHFFPQGNLSRARFGTYFGRPTNDGGGNSSGWN